MSTGTNQQSMVQLLNNNPKNKYTHTMYPSSPATAHNTYLAPASEEDRRKQWDMATGIMQGLGSGIYRGVVQGVANIPRAASYLAQYSPVGLPFNTFPAYRNAYSNVRGWINNLEDKARNLVPLSNNLTPKQNMMFDQVVPTMVDFTTSFAIPTGAASKVTAGAKYAAPIVGRTSMWSKVPGVRGVYGYFKNIPQMNAEWVRTVVPKAVGMQGDAISWIAPFVESAVSGTTE